MVVESRSERGLEDLGGGHNHAVREGRDAEPPHKSGRIRDGSVRIEKGTDTVKSLTDIVGSFSA